jgi:hypothetical protein
MSIASRLFLVAALAAGLMAPGGAHAALQQGFSIDLGDPTDHPDAGLERRWRSFGGGGAVQRPARTRAQEQWILLHHAHRQL